LTPRISTLLVRNLHDVFGENIPARRRAANWPHLDDFIDRADDHVLGGLERSSGRKGVKYPPRR
jgi:hypothetical protein